MTDRSQLVPARGRAWRLAAAFVLSGALGAQTPLVTPISLPPPPCGAGIEGVADCDGNGIPDFLVDASTWGSRAIAVLKDPATPGGGWMIPSPVDRIAAPGPLVCRVANLNGDEIPDVIVGSELERRILDGLGSGNGGFAFPGTGACVAASAEPVMLATAADFDGDGLDDVVVVRKSPEPGVLTVFRNLGPGWAPVWSAALAARPDPAFGAGDFDGDGNLDLIWTSVALEGGPPVARLEVALGTGDGRLIPQAPVPIGPAGRMLLAAGDQDGDRRADVLIGGVLHSDLGGGLPVVRGVPSGTAPEITRIPTPFDGFVNGTIADFDEDGVPDVVVEASDDATPFHHAIAMLRGRGGRAFSNALTVGGLRFRQFATIRTFASDVDGDGDADLVRSMFDPFSGETSVDLLRNETRYAPGCAGTGGRAPTLSTGVAAPGNSAFTIRLEGAAPHRLAMLGVSLSRTVGGVCEIGIDASPSQLLLPNGALGVTLTNGAGEASVSLPIPASPAVLGLVVYAQWGVEDPNGKLGLGRTSFATSAPHTILVW
jgi:hypothetical protein